MAKELGAAEIQVATWLAANANKVKKVYVPKEVKPTVDSEIYNESISIDNELRHAPNKVQVSKKTEPKSKISKKAEPEPIKAAKKDETSLQKGKVMDTNHDEEIKCLKFELEGALKEKEKLQ